jgi:hypothetical protein
MAVRLSASHGLAMLYSPETFFSVSGTHFYLGTSKSQGIMRLEGLRKWGKK